MTCDTWHSYFWTRWVGGHSIGQAFFGGQSPDLCTKSQVLFHFWIRIPYNRSAFKGKKQPGQLQQDGIVAVVRVGVTRNNRATYSKMGSSLSYARLSEVVSEGSGCVFELKVLSAHLQQDVDCHWLASPDGCSRFVGAAALFQQYVHRCWIRV